MRCAFTSLLNNLARHNITNSWTVSEIDFNKFNCSSLRKWCTGVNRKSWVFLNGIICDYMARSVIGQDEPNPVLWLATRAGKMELFCPLGTTRCIPQGTLPRKLYSKSFIDKACSVKMAGYWHFWRVYGPRLGQYPAILTSHLVNNPYLLHTYVTCQNYLVAA